MYTLIYWEDPNIKRTDSDYDEIESIRIKTVDEIQRLIWNKPKRCTLITLERSGRYYTKRDGTKTEKYQVRPLWEKNNPAVKGYTKYTKYTSTLTY